MQKIILKVILGICIAAVVAFAALIARELYIDWQSRSFYDDILADIETRPHRPQQTDNAQPPQSEEEEEWTPYVDFEKLSEIYPGIVGWIKLEGTQIDYPVMQYTDNDYFLGRLPDGTAHRSGSIFLDYRNESDFSDRSILIYGHTSRTDEMFGTLKHYRNREFFEANPVIYLYTPEADYKLELFAGHIAHSVRDHPPLEFENDEDFLEYIAHIKRVSVFSSDVEISAKDTIVSLVTCTYDFNDARLIIVGVLVDAVEK